MIITFKDRFVAGLFSTEPDFPMKNWDCLLEQAEITLNLLLPSRLNLKLSAYEYLNGTFDYNRTPMAPPGTRTPVHNKTHNRSTWAPHGQEGWYDFPLSLSYILHTQDRFRTRLWYDITLPSVKATKSLSPENLVAHTALDLTEALQNPSPKIPISHNEKKILQHCGN